LTPDKGGPDQKLTFSFLFRLISAVIRLCIRLFSVKKVFSSFLPSDDLVADVALAVMNRRKRAAPIASEPLLLELEKSLLSPILDQLQIFDKAHVIRRAVAIVDLFQAVTGEGGALEAVGYPSVAQATAASFYICALLVARAAAGAVGNLSPGFRDFMKFGEICTADGAVHAAGCDEVDLRIDRGR